MAEVLATLSLDPTAYQDYNLYEHVQSESLENSDIYNARLGAIKGLTLTNFKSFEDAHYVGPFTKFTSIIGPNGGGKSNVLDAISFVLGLSIRTMRCHSIEELIYSRAAYFSNVRQEENTAAVEIYFEVHNYLETTITLKRTLASDGITQVFAGDKQLSEKEFGKFLLLSKLVVPAKNFLMLQGDTDQLATIEPKKLTELFEILSGSIQHKNQCQKVQSELTTLLTKIRELQLHKGSLRNEQRKVKELRQTSDNYRKLNDEINSLRLKQKLLQLKQIENQMQELNEIVQAAKSSQNNQSDETKSILQEIHDCENAIHELKSQMNSIGEKEKSFKHKEAAKQFDTTQIDVQMELLQKQISGLSSLLGRTKKDKQANIELLEELQMDVKQKEGEISKLKQQQQIQLPKKYYQDFSELQNKFKLENEQLQSEITKLQQKQSILIKVNDQIEEEINTYQDNLNDTKQQQQETIDSNQQIENELDAQNERLHGVIKRLEQLQHQNLIESQELRQLKQYQIDKERELHLLEVQETDNIDEKETQLLVSQLRSMFRDFMGELSSLCNPELQQYGVALKIALGQRLLCALVVETEGTAKEINKHLKNINTVKELIVLDRVRRKPDDSKLRGEVAEFADHYKKTNRNGKAFLAIDVIKCDEYLEKVLSHLLHGIVICDSYQVAIDVQKARIPGVKQVISFDGMSVATSGMIVSHGSQARIAGMRNFRSNNPKIANRNQKETVDSILRSLDELKQKINSIRSVNVQDELKHQSGIKMNIDESKVKLLQKQHANSLLLQKLKSEVENVEEKLNELKSELKQRTQQLKDVEFNLQGKQDQLKNQQSSAFKEFAQKNKLSEDDLIQIDQQQNIIINQEIKQQQLNKLLLIRANMEQEIEQFDKKIADVVTDVQNKKTQLSKYEQTKIDISSNHQVQSVELKGLQSEELTINSQIKIEQRKLKQLVQARERQVKQGVDNMQALNSATRKMDQFKSQMAQLIEECEIESIPIKKQRSQHQASLDFDDYQMSQIDIDYEPIKQELKQKDYSEVIKAISKLLEQKEMEIAKYLSENLQVGLIGAKTDEKFTTLETNIDSITTKLRQFTEKETQLNEMLVSMRQQRKVKFESLFERVERELKAFYQKLTENQNRIGGSVILYVENKDEPYDGGIIYTPNPPNKKYIFDNSEQLSGGEKAMASIAMMLAINAALECPLILMDEVDANLDQENSEKQLIQQSRLRQIIQILCPETQFIVVSHNVEFFQHSQSLVGVTIQHQKTTSEAFSLQLQF